MILVTIGSTKFDELFKTVDTLIGEGKIKEKVVMQIGQGDYVPKHCEWFRFKPSLDKDYEKASIIIMHMGAGSIFGALLKKKKIICTNPPHTVNNPGLALKMQENNHLMICKDLKTLSECIEKVKEEKFNFYVSPKCTIDKEIKRFL